jgi:DNA modification methylase
MKPYAQTDNYTLYLGDAWQVLDSLPENSVDAVVTDPPYEIGFMNKGWDNTGVAFNRTTWEKVLRVLKPGGHLLAFNHSRTFHRMAVAIEDAGFEIRDTIMWLYGSGFPKSHDISKAIDRSQGENRDRQLKFVNWMRTTGLKQTEINKIIGKVDQA